MKRRGLKAYVRYDGEGRIIPGSLILSRIKPRVGNWIEINTYECCNPTTTTTSIPLPLMLVFDNISNADTLVDDSSNVDNWNTFFDLPNYGSPFTSVTLDGNTIELWGGSNIETRINLMSDYSHILEVWDYAGCIVTLGDQTFGGGSRSSSLQKAYFPNVTETKYDGNPSEYNTFGVFGYCEQLTYVYAPKLSNIADLTFYRCKLLADLTLDDENVTTLGQEVFTICQSIPSFNFPNLISAGELCFNTCQSITSIDFPNLINAGIAAFNSCTSLTTVNLPSLISLGDDALGGCDALETVNLPSCTTLGSTTGNDYVFNSITGCTITLTIKASLMTNNLGNPDGDIQYLQASNTVTIITT